MESNLNYRSVRNLFISNGSTVLIISLAFLIAGAYTLFPSANNWTFWLYDDVEHLDMAYNLFHGKGLTIDFIDLEAAFSDTNIPSLSKYDEISHPLQNKGPVYFIVMGAWLSVTGADYTNWYFWGSILNTVFAASFVVIFYLFVRRHLGSEIAYYSTPVVAVMPSLLWFSVRIRPEVMAYAIMAAALYFAASKTTTRNVIIVGVLTALAHLTHPIGMLVGISYLIFLLYKRNFRLAGLLLVVWALVLSPWMVRNYIVYGDFTQGLGILIPKNISLQLGNLSGEAPNSSLVSPRDLASITNTPPLTSLPGMVAELGKLYGMKMLFFILPFSVLAYLSFHTIVGRLSKKKNIAILLLTIAGYGVFASWSAITDENVVFSQITALVAIPLAAYLFFRLSESRRQILTSNNNDAYVLLAIFAIIGFLVYLVYAQISSREVPEIRMIIMNLFMIIPIAIVGIKKLVDGTSARLKMQNPRAIASAIMICILATLSIVQVYSGIPTILAYQNEKAEQPFQKSMHTWIRENIPTDSKIATDLPHTLNLRTGNEAVQMYYEFRDNVDYERWVIKKFDIDFLVLYFDYHNPLWVTNLGDVELEMVYNNGIGTVYKVVPKFDSSKISTMN